MNFVDFSQFKGQLHPLDVYQSIFPSLQKLKPAIYISGPITSGGAIRLKNSRPEITITEVVQLNKIFAVALLELLKANFSSDQILIFPHQLGALKLPNTDQYWSEKEYLSLWLMVISRMDLELAQQYINYLDKRLPNDKNLNNHDEKRRKRVRQFLQLEQATRDFIQQHLDQTHFVDQILALPDSNLSLGCTLEKRLAQQFAVPTFEVVLNPDEIAKVHHPLQDNELYQLLLQLQLLGTTQEATLAALYPLMTQLNYALS